MAKNPNPVSLAEVKRLVSARLRDPKTPTDSFIKGILFLERHSAWKRRSRKLREPDLNEVVRRIEAQELEKSKSKLQ